MKCKETCKANNRDLNRDRIRYSLTIINNMSTATPQKNIWSKEIKKKKWKKNRKSLFSKEDRVLGFLPI